MSQKGGAVILEIRGEAKRLRGKSGCRLGCRFFRQYLRVDYGLIGAIRFEPKNFV